MALITLLNAQLAFGHVALLDHTGFSLENNERVGLIGRNGAGKSSLLNTHRILSSSPLSWSKKDCPRNTRIKGFSLVIFVYFVGRIDLDE